ncbi:AIR synthase-related protein [bacterium]|nr:AIR synthase-related protein [bacterium]MCI0566479.1 AIR synthase-related protein [bacterium]MCI0680168.1 AIR synthase-related protein [bacterium]
MVSEPYNPQKPFMGEIERRIKRTWETPHLDVRKDGTRKVVRFKKPQSAFIANTDGIGEKGYLYLWDRGLYSIAAIDSFAMAINDMARDGGVPVLAVANFLLPEDNTRAVREILSQFDEECARRNIAHAYGDTAVHMHSKVFEVITTLFGIPRPIRTKMMPGESLIGLSSNGLHSNGFSKIKDQFGDIFDPAFIMPTIIYYDTIAALREKHRISGCVHITGGGFTKIKERLCRIGGNADAHILFPKNFNPSPIFNEIRAKGVSSYDMYRWFNCGIGFVIAVPEDAAPRILKDVPESFDIGYVTEGTGQVHIKSYFSGEMITY